MCARLAKHRKVSLWAILLKSRHPDALQFTFLTKDHGVLIASTKDLPTFLPYTHNISVMEILISPQRDPYVQLHAITQEYPFLNLNHHLAKLTRASLWQESIILTNAGGSEQHFFTLYYYLLSWLDQCDLPAPLLDTPFLYYFLLLNGLLAPHVQQQISFKELVALNPQDRKEYFIKLAQNKVLYQQLYHIFLDYLPYKPKSLLQLHRYD